MSLTAAISPGWFRQAPPPWTKNEPTIWEVTAPTLAPGRFALIERAPLSFRDVAPYRDYLRRSVELNDLTEAQAERAEGLIREALGSLGDTPAPDLATNEWGHAVLFWISPEALAELRITPDGVSTLATDRTEFAEEEFTDLREAVAWLRDRSSLLRKAERVPGV